MGSKVILGADHHMEWRQLWKRVLKEMESKRLLMKDRLKPGKHRTLKNEEKTQKLEEGKLKQQGSVKSCLKDFKLV